MPERKLTVFLVDDESIIRNGMKKLFDWESNGFTITGEAENGRDALPLILSLKPDIIITDLKMPFCDGITLASEIKKALPSAETVILTGYDEFEFAKQAIKIGVFDFLLKPGIARRAARYPKPHKAKAFRQPTACLSARQRA